MAPMCRPPAWGTCKPPCSCSCSPFGDTDASHHNEPKEDKWQHADQLIGCGITPTVEISTAYTWKGKGLKLFAPYLLVRLGTPCKQAQNNNNETAMTWSAKHQRAPRPPARGRARATLRQRAFTGAQAPLEWLHGSGSLGNAQASPHLRAQACASAREGAITELADCISQATHD